MPLLYLGHGLLAIAGFFVASSAELGRRTLLGLGTVGASLGVVLFFLRHTGVEWRTTVVEPGPAAAAGLGAAAAWLLIALGGRDRHTAWAVPLVGAASSSLILFALNRWTVPALLFWLATSVALAALVRDEDGRAQVWVVLAVSDALVVSGLVWHAVDTESWMLPASAGGFTWWFLAAGAVIRSCALPKIGAWAVTGSPALPLFAGSSFALLTGVADREQPWLGLAFVVLAVAVGLWAARAEKFDVTVIGAWPIAAMLCVLLVVPGAPWQAAAASLFALTAVLLWPRALGRAQVERGLLLAFIPPFAGFSALTAAAVSTFDRATASPEILEAAPWAGVTGLLPVLLATGVILGARLGRSPEPEHYEPGPVIATWTVFGLALVAGLWPRFVAPDDPGSAAKVFVLHVIALVAAALAARFLHGQDEIEVRASPLVADPLHLPPVTEKVVVWSSAGLAALIVVGAVWFTISGLRVGFL